MTIYGKTLGVFLGEKNECSRKEGKTDLQKNKIVVFWVLDVWFMTRISSRITSLWRHNDVTRDEVLVIDPYFRNSKNYNFGFMQFRRSSVATTFIAFTFKYPYKSLTVYGHVAGNLNFFN